MDMCALLMLEAVELIVIAVIVELFNVLMLAVGETFSTEKFPVEKLAILPSMVPTAITETEIILEFKLAALTVLMVAVVPTIVPATKPLAFSVDADATEV
jgi:hypothetical protein